jgi:hypothetical protein
LALVAAVRRLRERDGRSDLVEEGRHGCLPRWPSPPVDGDGRIDPAVDGVSGGEPDPGGAFARGAGSADGDGDRHGRG